MEAVLIVGRAHPSGCVSRPEQFGKLPVEFPSVTQRPFLLLGFFSGANVQASSSLTSKMIPSWLPNATFKVMRKIYGHSQIGMSAFKGLIAVMLSWGQHLSARDIKAMPPPSELSCLQRSESLGLWCWSDESYQPRGGDPQGPGEPHWETCSFVSFTGSGLVFTCFPTISRPVGLHQRLEVPSRGGIRVDLASQCSFQNSRKIPEL